MKIDISPLKKKDGRKTVYFQGKWLPGNEEDRQKLSREGVTFHEPWNIRATIWKDSDCFQAEIRLSGQAMLRCDRCNEPVTFQPDLSFNAWYCPPGTLHIMEKELGDRDGHIGELKGTMIDLDPGVWEQIILHLPSKKLCSSACAGLCIQCGQNLNKGSCRCANEEVDVRLADLAKWFDLKKG